MRKAWRIEMLGHLRMLGDGQDVSRFQTQQTACLLGFLALRGRATNREELIELIWPDVDLSVGRSRLSQAVWALRRQLEPPGITSGSVLEATRSHVGLNPESFVTDVAEFGLLLKSSAGKTGEAQTHTLQRAVALYQGEFLPSLFDDWVLMERQRLSDLYLEALQQLARLHKKEKHFSAAIECLQSILAVEPLQEKSHLDLMKLLVLNGQPSLAVRQYCQLEAILLDQLGERPSAEAMRLKTLAETAPEDIGEQAERAFSDPPKKLLAPNEEPYMEPGGYLTQETHLPVQLTRFFGRGQEIEHLCRLLVEKEARLITLVGPAGSGKTRLSIEVGARLAASFPGGIWFVPLADATGPNPIPTSILQSLGVSPRFDASPDEQMILALRLRTAQTELLMVLDNFETVVEHGSLTVRKLLEGVPGVSVIVTSRQKLRLEGEFEQPVDPLPMPPEGSTDLADLMQSSSMQLFVNRAQAVRPYFQLTARNAEVIAQLCRRLDGLPLAIELAAALVHMLSPLQMLQHIEERHDLLVSRRRDIAPRHRSLRAATDYSYLSLPPELQRLFLSVSIFQGGWTLESAAFVCREDKEPNLSKTFDLLLQLKERSLIISEESESGMRYQMFETLHDYALEKLNADQLEILFARHLEYFCRLAGVAEIKREQWQAEWLSMLDSERENIRVALVRGADSAADAALGLASSLELFWEVKGLLVEGSRHLEHLLDLADENSERVPSGLNAAARLQWLRGDFSRAVELAENALATSRNRGLPHEARLARYHLATAKYRTEQLEGLQEELEDNLAGSTSSNDDGVALKTLMLLGNLALDAKEMEVARERYQRALDLARRVHDDYSSLALLSNIGLSYFDSHEYERARSYWRRTLDMEVRLGERTRRTTTVLNLGLVAAHLQDFESAHAYCAEAISDAIEIGDSFVFVECVEVFGILSELEGDQRQGARLMGAASGIRIRLKMPPSRITRGQALEEMKQRLGAAAFDAEWREGQSMDISELVACLLPSKRGPFNLFQS